MVQDLVSIIIPCYNGERFIDRCMNCLVNQTYKKLEIIVVNDGSSDKSEQKIKNWKNKLVEQKYIIKYLFQENKGLGAAINSGLKLVTGEYLSLLDVDDLYMPLSIEKRINYLKAHEEFGMVRTNGWFVKDDPDSEPIGLFVNEENEKKTTNIFSDLLLGKTNNWAGTYMIRTDLLFQWYPDRNIYSSRYGQNLQLMLPIAYTKKSGFIDEPLMMYIRHDQSSTIMRAEKEEDEIRYLCKNQQGYLDIKEKMIDMIVKDTKECIHYKNLIRISYYRQLMIVAAWFKNKGLMKSSYAELKKRCRPTVGDRITYCKAVAPYFCGILSVLRKLVFLVRRLKDSWR